MTRLCYLTRNYRNVSSSGNKAKTDNEDTLARLGAMNVGLRRTYYKSKVLTFFLDIAGVLKCIFCLRKGDVLLLQYPVKKYFSFICKMARRRGVKTIALIHDLGSFRRKKLTVEKEIRRLMAADYVIASNAVMQEWLRKHGYRNPLGALGLFDYRSEAKNSGHQEAELCRMVYAGALAMRKNSFILQLAHQELAYEFHIYGNTSGLPDLQPNEHIVSHDFMPSDTFISDVNADFGLVWDGDSLDSCTGSFGEYLQYNSPHKVSFYLRAGLPVIIWRQAAVASIVEQEGIGLCIDSLNELNTLLPTITKEQMATMRANVNRVSERLRTGGYLTEAVNTALMTLKPNAPMLKTM